MNLAALAALSAILRDPIKTPPDTFDMADWPTCAIGSAVRNLPNFPFRITPNEVADRIDALLASEV